MKIVAKTICFFKLKPAAFTALFSGVALAIAYMSQYIGGLAPCDLCWTQRYVLCALLALSLITLAVKSLSKIGLFSLVLTSFASALVAGYHAGIEYKWWEGVSTCSSGLGSGLSVEELWAKIQGAPLVRCDEAAWKMFNISMAGYNFIISLAVALIMIYLIKNKGCKK